MKITPNFNFNGQCSDALELYQRAFDANVICRIEDDESQGRIFHAEIMLGDQRVMMCDNQDVPFNPTASLSLTVTFDTKEAVLHAYEVLKDGGRIIYPVQSTAYSSCFVSLFDRFGFRWVLMTEHTDG